MLHNWRAGALVWSTKGGTDKILSVAFSPSNAYIVTAGINHVCFWIKSATGTSYKQQRGILGSVTPMQAFLSIAFAGENTVLGAADGSLVMFNGEFNATGVVPAHAGPVTAMYSSGVDMLTGGADGNVKTWKTKSKITETGCHAFGSGIRSVYCQHVQRVMMAGIGSAVLDVLNRRVGVSQQAARDAPACVRTPPSWHICGARAGRGRQATRMFTIQASSHCRRTREPQQPP
jgi:hypothetical protein